MGMPQLMPILVAPHVYMCLTQGLYVISKSIGARGLDALTANDELRFDFDSADLLMQHPKEGPGAMKLGVFADLIYGVTVAVHRGLHTEVKLDVWDKQLHVANGWLLNKDHPRAGKRLQSLIQSSEQPETQTSR